MGALCSSLASTSEPPYDDLPPEILDLVIARLPDPADRARVRAACRSWHAAVRRLGPQPWRMPSTMSIWRRHRYLPYNAHHEGSTDDWLVVRIGKEHKYMLHNPFFNKNVPLTELDAIIIHEECMIYKFLMRSGADDFIAVITNNMVHAFMVIWPGKGVWLPKPWTRPYIDVIDFAFLQGKLYAITRAEDLIPFDLALDSEGRPVVTMGRRLIKLSDDDDDDEEQQVVPAQNDITIHNCSSTLPNNDRLMTSRHLIESRGKLLMVRHHYQLRPKKDLGRGASLFFTRWVEILEADIDNGAWMPVTGGLGGRALFISINFSKSIAAPCGEVKEDVIYFMSTGDVFDLKSGTCNPSRLCRTFGREMWLFQPELVF